MKIGLLIVGIAIFLTGCVILPAPQESYVKPTVEVVYIWDAGYVRYYYLSGNRRYYMPYGWKHPHRDHPGHRH